MLGTTVNALSISAVVDTLERTLFIDLGLAVTEINTKKYRNTK